MSGVDVHCFAFGLLWMCFVVCSVFVVFSLKFQRKDTCNVILKQSQIFLVAWMLLASI